MHGGLLVCSWGQLRNTLPQAGMCMHVYVRACMPKLYIGVIVTSGCLTTDSSNGAHVGMELGNGNHMWRALNWHLACLSSAPRKDRIGLG